MHGGKIETSIDPIDMADQFGRFSFELRCLGQCGCSDLNKHDITPPLGIHLEQLFKRLQFVVYSLCRIQLFSSDNDLLVLVQRFERFHLWRDTGSIPIMGNTLDVDSDGAVTDGSDRAVGIDASGGGFVSTNPDTGGYEMARIGIGLERDNVGAEHPIEDLSSFCGHCQLIVGSQGELGSSLGRHLKISEDGQGVCMNIPIMTSAA